MKRQFVWLAAGGLLAIAALGACGDAQSAAKTPAAPGGSKDASRWPADDRSMCDWRNKPELEVTETAGPGARRANVRRVFKTFGELDSRHKTLICREIDSNLDGIKDVVRTFNSKGEALHEESDRDFDGRIDEWKDFVDGRISQEDLDTNKDGKRDLWKFYVNGQLQRIRRDRNFDGKPDVWEIYTNGRLERMGTDETYDGHVDRWDRDEQLKREADVVEKRARDEMAAVQADAGTSGGAPAGGGADAGAVKGVKGKK